MKVDHDNNAHGMNNGKEVREVISWLFNDDSTFHHIKHGIFMQLMRS